jgi:hypothetical protein
MKELRQWGYEVLNWTYTLENRKLVRCHYKDIRTMYPSLYFNNYPKYKR